MCQESWTLTRCVVSYPVNIKEYKKIKTFLSSSSYEEYIFYNDMSVPSVQHTALQSQITLFSLHWFVIIVSHHVPQFSAESSVCDYWIILNYLPMQAEVDKVRQHACLGHKGIIIRFNWKKNFRKKKKKFQWGKTVFIKCVWKIHLLHTNNH